MIFTEIINGSMVRARTQAELDVLGALARGEEIEAFGDEDFHAFLPVYVDTFGFDEKLMSLIEAGAPCELWGVNPKARRRLKKGKRG